MRVVMIHALAESIPPVRLAFMEEFPEAEVVNLLDEGLLVDFPGSITPSLRRRMSSLICYCQDHNADAIGLACSVYAPVVDSARDLVEVPLVSSYGPVMAEAVAAGPRVGVIATNEATMSDSRILSGEGCKGSREKYPDQETAGYGLDTGAAGERS